MARNPSEEYRAAVKRLFDITAAGAGLVVLSPLLVSVAALIKCTSKGPVLFRQVRMGRNFTPFSIYKFRTMVADAPISGPALTVGDDARITSIGHFLRKTKIDELPQLINVLKGEMSLVGPRPEVLKYVEQFKAAYADILKVRPGMTDLASLEFIDEASILAKARDPEAAYLKVILPRKIQLAKIYAKRASFTYDLAIIGKTVIRLFLADANDAQGI